MGLLPKGVKEFNIDNTGRFEVHLDEACNAKFESELHYDMNVTGNLSYGQIGALSGISAQELFLWFPVKGIRVDVPSSGLIYFDVGVVFKQFSLSLLGTATPCATERLRPLGTANFSPELWQSAELCKLRGGTAAEAGALVCSEACPVKAIGKWRR
ncbi:hypothetical protein Tsubulata_024951 [Turnera subulata]|uniref:Uncharacterized protein n=1 Tax=Turnera subulata TaxID=218843 RepID=A0A9Q0FKJ8_9ROSI|nr:hypothetical protein Tsubulata_024951 [Turnera subulata]